MENKKNFIVGMICVALGIVGYLFFNISKDIKNKTKIAWLFYSGYAVLALFAGAVASYFIIEVSNIEFGTIVGAFLVTLGAGLDRYWVTVSKTIPDALDNGADTLFTREISKRTEKKEEDDDTDNR